jgi:hypothetical protein
MDQIDSASDVRFGSLADPLSNISLMSGLGRKADVPSWSILRKSWGYFGMSAFLQSGRSDALKSTKSKVRFRPEAVGATATTHLTVPVESQNLVRFQAMNPDR